MAKVSSGLSLSSNYFMRNFYANNRNVIKTSGRNDYTKIELSFEDSRALTRASDYEKELHFGEQPGTDHRFRW